MSTLTSKDNFQNTYNNSLSASIDASQILAKPAKIDRKVTENLNNFQKLLLITDGTVTDLLRHYLNEDILVEKLREEFDISFCQTPVEHQFLIGKDTSSIHLREVTLEGDSTRTPCLYAVSSVLLDNLPPHFKNDLIESNTPIGHLWSKYRFETYKTDFFIKKELSSLKLSELLRVPIGSEIISRTYCVYSQGKKTMIITEKFSTRHFVY